MWSRVLSTLATAGPGVLLSLTAAGASAADLEIVVEGVRNTRGHVLAALCREASFLGAGCPYTGSAPASPGEVRVVLTGIEPGLYAVQVFHDENDNIDIDRTLVGMPKEGMGFSNDAPMRFGPPRFSDAAVRVPPDGATVRLTLHYHGE